MTRTPVLGLTNIVHVTDGWGALMIRIVEVVTKQLRWQGPANIQHPEEHASFSVMIA